MDERGCKYDVFIDYQPANRDKAIAARLYSLLKKYRVPGKLRKKYEARKIKNIYFESEEDISKNELTSDEIIALKASRYLIVICSSKAKYSKRTCDAINIFNEHNRIENVQALLIEGEPEDAFPEELRKTVIQIPAGEGFEEKVQEIEPLAADIRDIDMKKSLLLLKNEKLRLIAPIIGCSYNDLKRRHIQRKYRKISFALISMSIITLLFSIYGIGLWTYTEIQKHNAEMALINTRKLMRIEKMQTEIANAAVNKMYVSLPYKLKSMPEVRRVVQEMLSNIKTSQPKSFELISPTKKSLLYEMFFGKYKNYGSSLVKGLYKQIEHSHIGSLFDHVRLSYFLEHFHLSSLGHYLSEFSHVIYIVIIAIIGAIASLIKWLYYKWNLNDMKKMKYIKDNKFNSEELTKIASEEEVSPIEKSSTNEEGDML